MISYIIRRILLSIPTFIGTTIIFFIFLQLLPGGPVEQAIMRALYNQGNSGGREGGMQSSSSNNVDKEVRGLSQNAIQRLKEYYDMDKPLLMRYFIWLGLWPRDVNINRLEKNNGVRQTMRTIHYPDGEMRNIQRWLRLGYDEKGKLSVYYTGVGINFAYTQAHYNVLPLFNEIPENAWRKSSSFIVKEEENGIYKIYEHKFKGALQGYMGISFTYSEPVMTVIMRRMPISLYFGLTGLLLTYLISIPLGLFKAVHHQSVGDIISTFLIFLGYSVPGYILGIFLISLFTAGGAENGLFPLAWFPVGNFVSNNFSSMSFIQKVLDLVSHMVLPTIAWNIGSFAALTMLMKNTVLDELSQDYVRTGFSKGLSEKNIIYRHVFKNALVPIAPGIVRFFFIFFSGSMLIEKTFNIQGMGLLTYNAMLSRDYPIVLAFMFITTVIGLLAGIIADLMYAVVDPRIRFH